MLIIPVPADLNAGVRGRFGGKPATATPSRTPNGLRRFLANEDGTATIELLFWIPVMFFLLFLVIDTSVALWKHEEMARGARLTAREVAIGHLVTTEAVESHVAGLITGLPGYTVAFNSVAGTGEFSVSITAPVSDLAVVGVLPFFATSLTARATMIREPGL